MKTHFCHISYGNESQIHDEYSESICGLEEFKEGTNQKEYVTCKKCLKKIELCEKH